MVKKFIIDLTEKENTLGDGKVSSIKLDEVIDKLELVLENKLSREEVSDWAYKWMMVLENEEGWETTDYDVAVFKSLTTVYGMDLLNSPTEYLHCEDDIRDWIEEFKKTKKSFTNNL